MECGIQNSTLTLTIIEFSFGDNKALRDELIIFPLLYSFFLILDALFLVGVFRYTSRNEVDESAHDKVIEVAHIVPDSVASNDNATASVDKDNVAKPEPFVVQMATV
jgi:hypothetical protein